MTYPVGYKRPPVGCRFRKGVSGNPNGRPKGSSNLISSLEKALNERVTVRIGNRTRTITKKEAIAKTMVNNAVKGDHKAATFLLNLSAQEVLDDPTQSLKVEVEFVDPKRSKDG